MEAVSAFPQSGSSSKTPFIFDLNFTSTVITSHFFAALSFIFVGQFPFANYLTIFAKFCIARRQGGNMCFVVCVWTE